MSHGGLGIEHLVDVEPIGVGERRDLFAATDLKLERRVAVRVLPALGGVEERSRFLDEARLLAAVSGHPNVVRVYDVGFAADGRPYLILELTSGPDLATWLQARGPLPWPRAIELTLQLASGLAQVHRVGWLHRDLRPASILLAGPNVKLSDVGLLPSVPTSPREPETVVHRAPETLDGDGDPRSDLYSLTSILHQMIDGQPAHWRPDDTVEALESRIATQAAPSLDPDMAPGPLRIFVGAGLSADPLDRPQDTSEFVRELELIRLGRTTGSTRSVLHATATTGAVPAVAAPTPADQTAVAWPPPGSDQRTPYGEEASTPPAAPLGEETGTAIHRLAGASMLVAPAPVTIPAPAPEPSWIGGPGGPSGPEDRADRLAAGDGVEPGVEADQSVGSAPVEPAPIDVDGPRPDERTPGVGRSPLLVGAVAMIAIGLIGLVTMIALGLRGSTSEGTEAAPLLPDPDAEVAGDDPAGDPASAQLAPLAMLEESTTTTVSPELMSTTEPPPERATVPALVGLDVEVAGQRLADAGFDVLVVGRVSPGSLPGTVIEQTPAAGSMVELPLSVTLFIPRSATLPVMVGRPANTVCLQLAALDLKCEQTLQFDDRVPAGAVISTDPVEGTAFTPGATIRLRVSRGPLVEVAVPQVAGTTEEEARGALSDAGFLLVTVATTPSDNVPAGRAIGTEPAAGTRLGLDQSVTISISSGPAARVTMPDLVGMDRAAAEAALAAVQLQATFVNRDLPAGDPNVGKVVVTDPAAGAERPAGSAVTVTVGAAATSPGSTTSSTVAGGADGG